MNDGIQTQTTSLLSTAIPLLLKKRVMLIGETLMTFHGKKYRSSQNGAKNATPNPPVVHASKIGCDAVEMKNVRYNAHQSLEKGFSER